MKTYTAAIDLGTTKVVCLVGEKSEYGYRVVSYHEAPSKGILRGEVVNIQNVLDSLAPTINYINQDLDIKINEVYVGIAGQHIRCSEEGYKRNRKLATDLISEEEIEEMKREMFKSRINTGEKILHVIPQSYNVDDHIGQTEVVGMAGSQIEGNYKLFIGRTNSAEHSRSVINRLGLNLKELVLEPFATSLAVLSEDECEIGVAMVDIGGGTTDVLIIENNIVRHTAVIPFGGNSITEDLKQGCGISSRNAEQIKIQYGSSVAAYAPDNQTVTIPSADNLSKEIEFKFIANIIEARVAEIIEAIMYEIERSGYKEKIHSGIVLTGGGAQLAHISKLVNYMTGFSVRIASPNNSVTFETQETGLKPSLSTAVGLLIYGCNNTSQKVTDGEKVIEGTLFPIEEIEITKAQSPERPKLPKKEINRGKKRQSNHITKFINVFFDTTNNDA